MYTSQSRTTINFTLNIHRKKVVKKQDLGLYVMNTYIKGACE